MTNVFDRLPPSPVGDPDIAAIYRAVGHALSSWESLESEQAQLFGEIVQGGFGVAIAIYGLSTSVNAKREMLDTALDWLMYQNEALAKEIKSALALTGNLSGRRNDIAHGQALGLEINKGLRLGYYLLPGIQATKKFWPLKLMRRPKQPDSRMSTTEFLSTAYAYAYTSVQIDHYQSAFASHAATVKALVGKLKASRELGSGHPPDETEQDK